MSSTNSATIREPAGNYTHWDIPSIAPIRSAAVLIDPTGTQGWAVGGFVDPTNGEVLDTADIDRYPAEGGTPPGVGNSPVVAEPLKPGEPPRPAGAPPTLASFAIGGGAQCADPCSDRANGGLGPDTWLSSALARAGHDLRRALVPLHRTARHRWGNRGSVSVRDSLRTRATAATPNCWLPARSRPMRRSRQPIWPAARASRCSSRPSPAFRNRLAADRPSPG